MHSFLQVQANGEVFIVDPSFKKVVSNEQSKYSIHYISSEKQIEDKIAKGSLELVLNEERGRTTVGVDVDRAEIYYMGFNVTPNKDHNQILDLKIHHFTGAGIVKTRYTNPSNVPIPKYAQFLEQMNSAVRESIKHN